MPRAQGINSGVFAEGDSDVSSLNSCLYLLRHWPCVLGNPPPTPASGESPAMQTEMEWEPQEQMDLELEAYIEMTRDMEVEVTMEMEMGVLGSHLR